MVHGWHRCDLRPQSVSAICVEGEFAEHVLAHVSLDEGWHEAVLRALANEGPEPDNSLDIKRIGGALANPRKQHLWGATGDEDFKSEWEALQRQRRALEPRPSSRSTPNLDRAAQLLRDLPLLWQHPGVTPEQQWEMAREVFEEVRLRDGHLVAVKPRPQYIPLFAYSLWRQYQFAGGNRSS